MTQKSSYGVNKYGHLCYIDCNENCTYEVIGCEEYGLRHVTPMRLDITNMWELIDRDYIIIRNKKQE